MYFNAQETRIPGLETTSHGWVSTYPLSQNAGRVKMVTCPLHNCLKLGVQSILTSMSGLILSTEKTVRVSVGAARRLYLPAERRGAGKGARERGAADPCRRAPFGYSQTSTGGGAETRVSVGEL